jgi:hypothetical protein
VTYGAQRFIADFDRELAEGGAVDGLARLRATLRAFVIPTARHRASSVSRSFGEPGPGRCCLP